MCLFPSPLALAGLPPGALCWSPGLVQRWQGGKPAAGRAFADRAQKPRGKRGPTAAGRSRRVIVGGDGVTGAESG